MIVHSATNATTGRHARVLTRPNGMFEVGFFVEDGTPEFEPGETFMFSDKEAAKSKCDALVQS